MMSISRTIRPIFNILKLELHRKFSSPNVFNISDAAVQAYLKNLMLEHEQLCSKAQRTYEESKRLFEIKPIVNVFAQRNDLYENIEALSKKQSDDGNVKEYLKSEVLSYLRRMTDVDRELQSILLEPQLGEGTVLLEVTAGTGGQEAMLFASEMFDMYKSYAKYKDWEISIISYEKSETGGIRKASMFVDGVGVCELMKMEAGVHCVHRIPASVNDIRIHTSTVSVAVLSKPTDKEESIPNRDLVIKTKTGNGTGEQQMKTTDSDVCITHTPTGTVVESQDGENIAIQELRTRLWKNQKLEQILNGERELQDGSSYINDQVRTYDYPENIVMEHREGGGTSHNLQEFMEGDFRLEQMQTNLLRIHWRRKFIDEINQFAEKMNMQTADTH